MKSKIKMIYRSIFFVIVIGLIGIIIYKDINRSENKNIATYSDEATNYNSNETNDETIKFDEEIIKKDEI